MGGRKVFFFFAVWVHLQGLQFAVWLYLQALQLWRLWAPQTQRLHLRTLAADPRKSIVSFLQHAAGHTRARCMLRNVTSLDIHRVSGYP